MQSGRWLKVWGQVVRVLATVAAVALVGMTLVTISDVVLRRTVNFSLMGSIEAASVGLLMLSFLALGYTELHQRHVRVTFLVDLLPKRFQLITEGFGSVVALATCVLMVWAGWMAAAHVFRTKQMLEMLGVPLFPFRFIIPLGIAVMAAQLIFQLLTLGKKK